MKYYQEEGGNQKIVAIKGNMLCWEKNNQTSLEEAEVSFREAMKNETGGIGWGQNLGLLKDQAKSSDSILRH